MATVKNINVSLTANTVEFEDGMRRGTFSLRDFNRASAKVGKNMEAIQQAFAAGEIGPKEFAEQIAESEKELHAFAAGFKGMDEAIKRTEQIMASLTTEEERNQAAVREINKLYELGAFKSQEDFQRALKATQDKIDGTSEAMKRAEQITRSLMTETEKYEAELREINDLHSKGAFKSQADYQSALDRTTARYRASIPLAELVEDRTDRLGKRFLGNVPVIGQFAGELDALKTPIGAVTVGFAAVAAAAYAQIRLWSSVASSISETITRMDEQVKAARRVGISTADFQRLEFAADHAGLTMQDLTGAMQRMNRAISESLVSPTSKAGLALRDLRVDISSLSSMSPTEAFKTLADAISNVQSPFERTRLAMALFEEAGAKLLPMLAEGRAGLDRMGKQADELNQTIGKFDSDQFENARDALTNFHRAWQGLENVLAVSQLPKINKVLEDLTNLLSNPIDAISDNWQSVTAGILGAATNTGGLNQATTHYWHSLRSAAAEAEELRKATEGAQSNKPPQIDPSEVQQYLNVLDKANERQQKLAENTAASAGNLPDVRMSAPAIEIPKSEVPVGLDLTPVKTFEETFARLRRQLESGLIDKAQFSSAFAAANTALDESLGKLEEFREKQQKSAEEAIRAQEELRRSQLRTLQQLLAEQRRQWEEANPALAIQRKFAEKVKEINELFAAGLITLEERRSLLQSSADAARSQAGELAKKEIDEAKRKREEAERPMREMRDRGKEIAERFKSPLEKFRESVAELDKLKSVGAINAKTYQMAMEEATQNAIEALKGQPGFEAPTLQVKGPAAIEAGTQAAFSAFQENKRNVENKDSQDKWLKKMEGHLAVIKRRGVVLGKAPL